jgi:hypothetical protein
MLTSPGRAKEDDVVLGGHEVQRPEVGNGVAFEATGVIEVELLQRLPRGNRAARMRPSPPWDSRAETSRCRHATRNSSWVQDSARARSASRATASRIVGAFNARVRKLISAVRSRWLDAAAAVLAGVVLVVMTPTRCHRDQFREQCRSQPGTAARPASGRHAHAPV